MLAMASCRAANHGRSGSSCAAVAPMERAAASRSACSSAVSRLDRGRSGETPLAWMIGTAPAASFRSAISNQYSSALANA
jgi:hypothetical protein